MAVSEEDEPRNRVLLFEVLWVLGAAERSDRPINGENGLNPVTRYGENAF